MTGENRDRPDDREHGPFGGRAWFRWLWRSLQANQSQADADRTSSDADQTSSDADEGTSSSDRGLAWRDQQASDRDQATADRAHWVNAGRSAAEDRGYAASSDERSRSTKEREANAFYRSRTSHERDGTALEREATAHARDDGSRARDEREADVVGHAIAAPPALIRELEELRVEAAAERRRAAEERARAAQARADLLRERERLEQELQSAHLDDLTGAYRREAGRMALSHEIDRARRSNGRFVVAFVDVDGLKTVNDSQGHAAGDSVLESVVETIRGHLRSFDPVIRYGGDEFVCGMSGADLAEAERRFGVIGQAVAATAGTGISVGFATLEEGDTPELLVERADQAMLSVRADRRSH